MMSIEKMAGDFYDEMKRKGKTPNFFGNSCPRCGSRNLSGNLSSRAEWDMGIKRYECRDCGRIFQT
ncbi:MAG: hypothetical protein LBE35_02180 [Clostridiales bacterium]|nr:hypothetical protein [Clostridiales bacterium]